MQNHPENAAGSSSSSALSMMLPAKFVQDPAAYLAEVASMPPSRQAMSALAGPVASWFSSPDSSASAAAVGSVYLQAAAVQLKDTEVKVGDVEQEMLRTKQQYEVLEAVGAAAAKSPRMGISSSEILPSLAQIMLSQPNHLQQASVEFLQCALLAEHYRYAERLIRGTWPRPNSTISVKQVLRYYYLRGMIHLGCDDPVMAHRCFWTCLTIPAEVNSKIMIEAWKKVVLVQCLLEDSKTSTNTRLPKAMPNVLGRLLASYKEASKIPKKGGGEHTGRGPTTDQPAAQPHQVPTSKTPKQQQTKESIETIVCYMDIAAAFYSRDKPKFESLQQQHEGTLQIDGNMGLLRQVHTQLIRNQIYHLSKIYSAIPMSKCAEALLLPEAEVPSALCQSRIVCEIQEGGMVVFGDQPTSTASSVDMTEWIQLLDRVQRLDVAISTSAKYHSLMRKDIIPDTAAERAQGPRGVDEF